MRRRLAILLALYAAICLLEAIISRAKHVLEEQIWGDDSGDDSDSDDDEPQEESTDDPA